MTKEQKDTVAKAEQTHINAIRELSAAIDFVDNAAARHKMAVAYVETTTIDLRRAIGLPIYDPPPLGDPAPDDERRDDYRLYETIVDIAFEVAHYSHLAGAKLHDDSREVVSDVISWAEEFESRYADSAWGEEDGTCTCIGTHDGSCAFAGDTVGRDYYLTLDKFIAEKIPEYESAMEHYRETMRKKIDPRVELRAALARLVQAIVANNSDCGDVSIANELNESLAVAREALRFDSYVPIERSCFHPTSSTVAPVNPDDTTVKS